MTRGTLILITDTNAYESCEFNGDMYFECHGEEVVSRFQNTGVKDRDSFEEMVHLFNAKNFQYPKDEVCIRPLFVSDTMNLRDNYIKDWFSDYLYIKNASNRNIHIKCKDENNLDLEYILQPDEIAWFCFGSFKGSVMEDEDLHAKDEEYVLSEVEAKEIKVTLEQMKKDLAALRSAIRAIENSVERIGIILETHEEWD